jgi:hypothetical protein
VASDDQIRSDVIGNAGADISRALLLTLKSVTNWPVDEFCGDLKDIDNQSVTWIDGQAIGILTATGTFENPDLKAVIRPLRTVKMVEVLPRYHDTGREWVDREMTINFETGDPIVVDVGRFTAGHYRDRANDFVSAALRALA